MPFHGGKMLLMESDASETIVSTEMYFQEAKILLSDSWYICLY